MDEQLDDVARRGEPLAGAHRVGGVDLRALRLRHRDVHDARGTLDVGVRVARGSAATDVRRRRVRLVDGDAAVAAARAVYERRRRRRASASSTRTGRLVAAASSRPAKPGARFFTAVHDGRRRAPDAVRAVRARPAWPDGVPELDAAGRSSSRPSTPAPRPRCGPYLFGIDLRGDAWSRSTVRSTIRCGGVSPTPRRLRVASAARPPVDADRRRRRPRWPPRTLRRRRRARGRAGRRLPPREQRTVARRRRARPAPTSCHAPTATPTSRSARRTLGAIYLGGVAGVDAGGRRTRATSSTSGAVAARRPLLHDAPVAAGAPTHF